MTAVAGGSLRYDEATNRVISGAIYEAVVTATIDGSPRTHREFIGRDSTA